MAKTTLNICSLACHGILEDILNLVVQGVHRETQGMDTFLHMVQLSSVCRQWSQCLIVPMCRTAIIEYRAVSRQIPGRYITPTYKWVSNINFIAARGMTCKTASLYISDAPGKGSSSFVAAMNNIQFESYSWSEVELLRLDRGTFMDKQVTSPDLVSAIFSLLTSRLHSITEVDYPIDGRSHTQGITLRAMLIKHYMPCSRTIYIRELYLTASLRLLRQDITSLDLNTHFVGHMSPPLKLPCSSLQHLRVIGANSGFSWKWFAHDADEQQIVFPELRSLALEFLYTGDEMGTASFIALNVRFPKLQGLRALNALVHFPDFYAAFTDSPLVSLHIAEMKNHLEHIDPSLIRHVPHMRVCPIECKSIPFYMMDPYSSLLSTRLPTVSANLVSVRPAELIKISWMNLQRLELSLSSLCYRSLDVLVTRLPSLHYLCVRYLTYSWHTVKDYEPQGLRTGSHQSPLSNTLEFVSLEIDDKSLFQASVKWLCNLVQCAPSLLALVVPAACVDEINQFSVLHGKDISVGRIADRRVKRF